MEFEIHITVNTNQIDLFKETCVQAGIKPIVIDLQNSDGDSVMMDVMTSSKHKGLMWQTEADRIKQILIENSFTPTRIKVEIPPFYEPVENGYYESHIRVITQVTRIQELRTIAKSLNSHLSKNVFKKLSDDVVYMMITARNDQRSKFNKNTTLLQRALDSSNFKYDKLETEYVIYDSCRAHDDKWINSLSPSKL